MPSPLVFMTIVMAVLLCVAAGAALTSYTMYRATALVARFAQTGQVEHEPAVVSSDLRQPNAEAAAQARVLRDALEKGADQLQAVAKANGTPMSRAQALKDAAAMLNIAPPLGGAQ